MAEQLAEKQWYIVTTYSMHETKTADNLIKRIKSMQMENYIKRVLVAEIDVPKLDPETGLPTGKTVKKNLYPGYIFVEMIMTDESWYIVRNTPGVTGIAGSSGGGQKPTPVTREEIEPVLKRMGEVDASMYDRYNVGDRVKVIHGPLEGTEGKIIFIDKETGACRVETVFFGRATPVDVEFSEIEKI
ncbi:MAG: transcription termination/antitermination protein NusG [Bacilli bacterium]|nr:transcription termination/antitermination protein NusG [Bacilli bacterium]MDY6430601.1 transcription termination/antitermination protein NusG [Bacilli bacterium]